LINLGPQKCTLGQGLLLAVPREPGWPFELQLGDLEPLRFKGWPNCGTAVSLLIPDWRSMGGVERVGFSEIKRMEGLELHRRNQAHRLWARSFDGETAMLLARLSKKDNLEQILGQLSPEQQIVFENALELANQNFVMDLTANYDLSRYYPVVKALLAMAQEPQDRLRLLSQFVVDLYHSNESRNRRFYARAGHASWLAAGWLNTEREFDPMPTEFRDQMIESEAYLMDEDLEIAWRSWCRFQDMR